MITVIDYGAGNLKSVANTLKFLDVPHQITSSPESVATASAILLPGVGHFGQMMRSLESLGVIHALRDSIARGTPYLGICLGMHALFEGSDEAPGIPGLTIFPGTIRRFPESMPAGLKVPHMGWNQLETNPASRLFAAIPSGSFVYFAHSFYLPRVASGGMNPFPMPAATADYAGPFVAAIEQNSVFGTQFHPEKSGKLGLQVVAAFAALSGNAPRSSEHAR